MSRKDTLNLDLDTIIVASTKQRTSALNEEMVVLNLDNEEYYVLNDSATAIWSSIQQPICWKNLIANLAQSQQDELKAFILDLSSAGLLTKTTDPAIAREINLSIAENPTLTCMGGMRELVAAAGSAGTGVGQEDPNTEGIEDTTQPGFLVAGFIDAPGPGSESNAPFFNDAGVGDDATGRPEDPGSF